MFQKYMHIERYGNDEVQGIEIGDCYIFPKIDGTNASVWFDNEIKTGSRSKELSIEDDNAGFHIWAINNENLKAFFEEFPDIRLYGEWLVPHSLKTYREDAWHRFYIFDICYKEKDEHPPFEFYEELLKKHNLDYIPPISIIRNAQYDSLLKELENNKFLIRDGEGQGEGIVIKNYDFENRFGRTIWAKMVTNEFKEKHIKEMGASQKENRMIEDEICENFVTKVLVDKVYAKIVNEMEGWNSKYISRLLNTVYHDLVNEEIWNIVKKMKNPTINFKTLSIVTIIKIKKLLPELF